MNHLGVEPDSVPDSQYDTKYQRSLQHYLTREALPKESNYRDIFSIKDGQARPTLDELHDSTYRGPKVSSDRIENKNYHGGWDKATPHQFNGIL